MPASKQPSVTLFCLSVTLGAMAAAVTATAILAVPNPIYGWMLARSSPGIDFVAGPAGACMVMFLVFAMGLGGAAFVNDRLPGPWGDARLFGLMGAACFIVAFLYDVAWLTPGGGGNLSASNSIGATLEGGRLTELGWITACRRAAVAAGLGVLMSVVFIAVRRLGAGAQR